MDSKELRVGNYVKWGLGVHKWEKDDFYGEHDLDYAESIPLTEEWLIKFGAFKRDDGVYSWQFMFEDGQTEVFQMQANNAYRVTYYGNWIYSGLEYVHQLQNLYFALTGDELTIND